MRRAIAATAILGTAVAVYACGPPGNKRDNENARDVRLVELTHQYHCHIGARINHQDTGAIIEPKGVDSAAKLGHVPYSQAVTLAQNFDVIRWCAL